MVSSIFFYSYPFKFDDYSYHSDGSAVLRCTSCAQTRASTAVSAALIWEHMHIALRVAFLMFHSIES